MKTVVILSFILFLSACTVGPNYTQPDVAVIPEEYKEAPVGWKFADPQDTCSRGEWWEIFNDPILNELEEKLNISNQNIAIAFAQYQAARALVSQAISQFYPTVSALASVTRQKASSSISSDTPITTITPDLSSNLSTPTSRPAITDYDLELNASWAIDIWGTVRRTVEGNIAGAQASEAQLASTQLLAQASLAQYYFQLRGLDGDQKILDDTVKNYERLLKITLHQYGAGTVSRANVLQTQSLLELAQAQALDNGILRAQYEHAIAVLIGEPPALFCLAADPLVAIVPNIPDTIPSTLLERRPDIANAERLVAQANAQIGVAISAYFPVLTLSAIDGYNSISLSSLFSKAAHFWSYGFQLAQILFDGGYRRAVIDQAKATYCQTVAQYRQTVLTAFQNVEDNMVSLRILDNELKIQEQALKTARETLELVLNQYKAGTSAFADVLNAEVTVYTAAKGVNDTGTRQMTSAVGLITALGGGWDTEMLENYGQGACYDLPQL